jgi:hypothetical protein
VTTTQTNLTLSLSPLRLQITVAYDLLICLHVPYNSEMVTLLINPEITEYTINVKKHQDTWDILPTMNYKETPETQLVTLHVKDNLPQQIKVNSMIYGLKLIRVYTEQFKTHEFSTFDISISPVNVS